MIYVFQQYTKSILPWRTVMQNIDSGWMPEAAVPAREARERCWSTCNFVGLQGHESYYPYQLSGGMQQRV